MNFVKIETIDHFRVLIQKSVNFESRISSLVKNLSFQTLFLLYEVIQNLFWQDYVGE